jgi:hypothetical protein
MTGTNQPTGELTMRQTLDCGKKAIFFASLTLALSTAGIVRAGSVPFVMVAQEHNVEHNKHKGVYFHVTADVNNLQGKPCTLAVYSFDTTGKPRKSLRKEFSDEEGLARTSLSFKPQYAYTQIQAKLFLPYDAITTERGPFKSRIVANVFDNDSRKWLATTPFRADSWFDVNPDKAGIERSKKQFAEEREAVATARKLHAQRKHAEFMALMAFFRRQREQEERRAEERRAEQRRADRLAEQRRADQRLADRLAEQRRADQRQADRLAEQRRTDQRRADQLAAQRRADQRRADQLAAQRRADQMAAQRRADEARRRK